MSARHREWIRETLREELAELEELREAGYPDSDPGAVDGLILDLRMRLGEGQVALPL